MARLARVVVPGIPHHVTQRGNGRARTFFSDDDYRLYCSLLADHCQNADVGIWAWVLMPNHVHLILTPADSDGIRRALSKVHRQYAGALNARRKRTGHFWQGRFGCVAMDETYLLAAVRYVVMNPVRSRLAKRAVDWRWSSVHAHVGREREFQITDTAAMAERIPDFAAFIRAGEDEELSKAVRRAESIGRPLGDGAFLDKLETRTGRRLKARKRGPEPKRKKSALSP